jgi:hypothetical protein
VKMGRDETELRIAEEDLEVFPQPLFPRNEALSQSGRFDGKAVESAVEDS